MDGPSSVEARGAGREELVRRIVRRSRLGLQCGDALCFGDLMLEPDTRKVRRAGRLIDLTPTEFRLLELFLRNPRRVLARSLIFTRVWGFDFGGMSNSLNVYVGYLRRKMEAGGEPRIIHTVRGVGYVLREPQDGRLDRGGRIARAGAVSARRRVLRRLLANSSPFLM